MSHYPPNTGQPPNWQGNQPQYPPQYPWGQPPDQSGQWGQQQPQPPSWQPAQYNQPTQAWQPVPPPLLQRGGKPPRKPLTKRDKIIGVGCLGIILLLLCGIVGAIGNAVNAHNSTTATVPMTIVVIPSNTPTTTSVQAVLPTDTPTIAPTDTPVPSPTATPTPRPTPTPTQPIVQQPTPTQAPHCVAVNNNPWCYNFSPGNLIYSPASAFCSYFACVSTFWTDTNGYVAECANGKYTHSATVSGACSRDGGVSQILYSH